MKSSAVFKRKNKLYFHSYSETTAGAWIATPPYISIDNSDMPSNKIRCLKEVLESSKAGIEHPKKWDNLFKPMLDLASVNSWSSFAKYAVLCIITSERSDLRLLPTRNAGPREGFDHLNDRMIVAPIDLPDEELSDLLDRAFEACE